jgi:general secretion pathway protein G
MNKDTVLRKTVRRPREGFSLVELMVVIVIIGLLASVVTFSVRSYLIRSKQNVAKLEISKMMQALETFYATYDRYPTNEEGLAALSSSTSEYPDGLISFLPNDPWGNPYEYVSPGRIQAFEITCYGADRREGGIGADEDLRSDQIMNR